RLKKELEVSRNNEETYRLEMLDITKKLGLNEETMFDEVKDKAERLNNIIKEVREYIEKYETISGYYDSNYDEHLKDNTYQKKSELHQTDKFVVRYPFLKIF
ncbi:MAG: hypothetical protein J5606_03980, partial [Bacteroidales bacterium]|nr:hypothetical protein [Bacteroidales bacterium]